MCEFLEAHADFLREVAESGDVRVVVSWFLPDYQHSLTVMPELARALGVIGGRVVIDLDGPED
ncbi:MAG: hypothetical protein LBI99_00490 [Propionibacteriaceae bacterium]|nr:hypothetical protein [Propionibacteriaceae bacterium]